MAHTQKLLKVLVHPDLWHTEGIQKLIEAGNQVDPMPALLPEYDLILGVNCWRIYPQMVRYIEFAVKAARLIRYPKKEKEVA